MQRYRKTSKRVTVKPALMVLMWSFFMGVVYAAVTSLSSYQIPIDALNIPTYLMADATYFGLIHLFYPIAGLLADLKFGRYKTIISSIWILVAGAPLLLFGSSFLVTASEQSQSNVLFLSIGGVLTCVGVILTICSTVAFSANVIQFGLDQLHDSSTDEQVVFIEWYTWVFYAASVTFQVMTEVLEDSGYVSVLAIYYTKGSMLCAVAIILITSLYYTHKKQNWFIFNIKLVNPYRLVYRITKFARKHKIPVNRSALTYHEDEIPSGLDLGKSKYGGPFTTEQVEDVKAFYGIFRILCSLGPIYFLEFAVYSLSGLFRPHILEEYYYNYSRNEQSIGQKIQFLLVEGFIVNDIILAAVLPVHIIVIRPFISYCIPKTHTRMGMGILAAVISLIISLMMDVIAHQVDPSLKCMLSSDPFDLYYEPNGTYHPSTVVSSFYYIIIIQQLLVRLFYLIVFVAKYEFILAQVHML